MGSVWDAKNYHDFATYTGIDKYVDSMYGRYSPYSSTRATTRRRSRKRKRYGGIYARRTSAKTFTEEKKFNDTELTSTALTTSWTTKENATMDCISAVAQGTTESTHLGRVYYIHSMHLKGEVVAAVNESQTAPLDDIHIRVAIVLDTQTNKTQMVATDAMDAGQSNDLLAFRNLHGVQRFKYFMDKTFIVVRPNTNEGASNLFANHNVIRPFTWNKRFKTPIKVVTSATTAVVGSIVDNSFHVIAIADRTGSFINYQVRIRYTD